MNKSSILNNRIEFTGVFTFYHFYVLLDISFFSAGLPRLHN